MFEIEWCGHISHVIAQGRCASNTGGKKTHQKKKNTRETIGNCHFNICETFYFDNPACNSFRRISAAFHR